MNFSLGHNFQSIEASNFKLHTQTELIKEKCSVQDHNSALCKFLLWIFVWDITSKV